MKLLDLFAGIGGFSLAAHWLGWQTAAFVERDKFCQQVLRKNFGDVPIYDDITTFDGRPFRGAIDVISGGFPCQPFSVAGKQKGKDDERHLFPQMLRVISEVRPRWIVAENVRGLLNISDGRVFEEICSQLEGENYSVQAFVVPASAVNAPHRRDRVWIVANSKDVLHERNSGQISRPDESADRAARSNERLSAPGRTDREFVADTDDTGHRTRRIHTNAERQTRGGKRQLSQSESSGHDQVDKDTVGVGCENRTNEAGHGRDKRQISVATDDVRNGNGRGDATNARDPRLQGDEFAGTFGTGWRTSRPATERFGNENWLQAATRFCGMDDVVPDRVDRLKSLGNAVVPLVVYELFRSIEAAEKL